MQQASIGTAGPTARAPEAPANARLPGPDALLPLSPALQKAIRNATLDKVNGSHDAIVVGAGATGGLAALLLAEAGLNVLVLDAGWRKTIPSAPVTRGTGAFVSLLANPAALRILPPGLIWKGRQVLKKMGAVRQPIQSQCYAWERLPEAFVDDRDNPYVSADGERFSWFRAQLIGGRMVIPGHGRQYFRLSKTEFAPTDGLSPKWPFAPEDLDPWYAEVERRLGLSGRRDGGGLIPDSDIRNTLTPTPAETALADKIRARWPNSHPMLGRYAAPMPSLDMAAATGRVMVRRGALARQILVENGKAAGVRFLDRETNQLQTAKSPLVFLCASTLETTRILMMSSETGLTDRSEQLGRNLMDHVMQKAEGIGPALAAEPTSPEDGRCSFLPRFDLRSGNGDAGANQGKRGFGVQVYQTSGQPGQSWFTAVAFGEMLPRAANRATLDASRKDAWGAPVLNISCNHGEHDIAAASDRAQALADLADITGTKLNRLDKTPASPGSAVHECGTARMGDDAANSVLDPFNQAWSARGLFVTDGSSMVSQGYQNPTLTLMALTARAVDHALGAPHEGRQGALAASPVAAKAGA